MGNVLPTGNPGEFAHGVNPDYPGLSNSGKMSESQTGKQSFDGNLLGDDQGWAHRRAVREGQAAGVSASNIASTRGVMRKTNVQLELEDIKRLGKKAWNKGKCPECKEKFGTAELLLNHLNGEAHVFWTDKPIFTAELIESLYPDAARIGECPGCDILWGNAQRLADHLNSGIHDISD